MNILLQGGPADGRVISNVEFTGSTLYRVPVATENFRVNIHADALYTPMQVAQYRFTGFARVTLYGVVEAVIYQFEGMKS